jgi:selenide,water dikinase
MAGEPALALSIAGFPAKLPPEVVAEVFRGGGEKAREAGCTVVGGHTLSSEEPMFGLAVIGFADPQRLFVKTGVRPGEVLVLSKPLGVGVITTALKRGLAATASIAAALESMKKLNRDAAKIFSAHGVSGCTDVTGFSLLGHALDLAGKSRLGLRITASSVSFLPGAREAAAAGAFPGGTARNRAAYERSLRFAPGVAEETRKLLFSPETSGGLLAAVPRDRVEACMEALSAAGLPAFILGEADASLEPGTLSVG